MQRIFDNKLERGQFDPYFPKPNRTTVNDLNFV